MLLAVLTQLRVEDYRCQHVLEVDWLWLLTC